MKYNMRNRTICRGYLESLWQLWNDNYYHIVNFIINVIKILSLLHIKALEWYLIEKNSKDGENRVERIDDYYRCIAENSKMYNK